MHSFTLALRRHDGQASATSLSNPLAALASGVRRGGAGARIFHAGRWFSAFARDGHGSDEKAPPVGTHLWGNLMFDPMRLPLHLRPHPDTDLNARMVAFARDLGLEPASCENNGGGWQWRIALTLRDGTRIGPVMRARRDEAADEMKRALAEYASALRWAREQAGGEE